MCICIVFFKIINDMRNRSKCKWREATTAELLMVIEFKQMVKIEVAKTFPKQNSKNNNRVNKI